MSCWNTPPSCSLQRAWWNSTDQRREQILAVNQELSSKGLRVLAFAYRDMPGAARLDFTDEREYTFIGLISMIDPPRPEAIQAVADAKRGGIRTVMITGDHRVTASAIARQIGILRMENWLCPATNWTRWMTALWTRSWSRCPSTPGFHRSTRSASWRLGSGGVRSWP